MYFVWFQMFLMLPFGYQCLCLAMKYDIFWKLYIAVLIYSMRAHIQRHLTQWFIFGSLGTSTSMTNPVEYNFLCLNIDECKKKNQIEDLFLLHLMGQNGKINYCIKCDEKRKLVNLELLRRF